MMKGRSLERNLQSLKHLFVGSVVHFGQPSCPGAAQMFYKVLLQIFVLGMLQKLF